MQDIWHAYIDTFGHALAARHAPFSPCTAFWPTGEGYGHWRKLIRLLQLDRASRNVILDALFSTVELRCGQPQERASLEAFRSSPFLQHGARTQTVYVYIDYVYDPWMVGSIAYDYPNVRTIFVVIEAPLERRDHDDLMLLVRQMSVMGKSVSLAPVWKQWQARHRSDVLSDIRAMVMPSVMPSSTRSARPSSDSATSLTLR